MIAIAKPETPDEPKEARLDSKRVLGLARVLSALPGAEKQMWPKWTEYIPHEPTGKQLAFLLLPHREALYGGAAGGGKLLPLDEVVPTPTGWKPIGELKMGDFVLGFDGKPTEVLWLSPIDLTPESYRLTFDDSSSVECCADHLWKTYDANELAALTRRDPEWRAKRRASRKSRATGKRSEAFTEAITERNKKQPTAPLPAPSGTVRRTSEIIASLYTVKGRANHAVAVASAIEGRSKTFTIDPWILGAWLGDGTTSAGQMTANTSNGDSEFMKSQFRQAGFEVNDYKNSQAFGILGLVTKLKAAGVFKNKHVPPEYLRASKEQRLALLQGLMDTDGTVCDSGSVEFTNTNKKLVDAVYELIVSLGWKASVIEGRAMMKGVDYGPKWDIKWTPSEYVFRLPRKREKQKLAQRRTTKFRYIKKADKIPSRPMRCIKVAAPDGLFLVGRSMIPTHNSDALLMAALQYVDVPGYSALIFRKSFADLKKRGALIDRSLEWLGGTDARWYPQEHVWRFPSGATLAFSYLDNPGDLQHHQSAEYQFCGFDELTQFWEEDYSWMFSRLRATRCPFHVNRPDLGPDGDPRCPSCLQYAPLSRVPIRMRGATNPGGLGHVWVKNRFSISNVNGSYRGTNLKRPFVPAYVQDNPYIDYKEYKASLSNLDPVTREQLLRGDWGVSTSGRFKKQWCRYYSVSGDYIVLGRNRQGPTFKKSECRLWMIVDPAASAVEIWKRGNVGVSPGEPSWTVVSSFLVTPSWDILWWKVRRVRVEVPGVLATIREEYHERISDRDGTPEFIGIEDSGLGIGVYQMCNAAGLPVRPMRPMGCDKVVRATDAMNRMERGKIWLPEQAPWLEDCETELFTWTGHPMEQADQIDTLSYAALMVSQEAMGVEMENPAGSAPTADCSVGSWG